MGAPWERSPAVRSSELLGTGESLRSPQVPTAPEAFGGRLWKHSHGDRHWYEASSTGSGSDVRVFYVHNVQMGHCLRRANTDVLCHLQYSINVTSEDLRGGRSAEGRALGVSEGNGTRPSCPPPHLQNEPKCSSTNITQVLKRKGSMTQSAAFP